MTPDPDRVAAAQAALANVAEEWLARPGVVSVEVARAWLAGDPTDPEVEVAIRVTVERLRPWDEVPKPERFPNTLHGVPVDVVEGRAPVLEPGLEPECEPPT